MQLKQVRQAAIILKQILQRDLIQLAVKRIKRAADKRIQATLSGERAIVVLRVKTFSKWNFAFEISKHRTDGDFTRLARQHKPPAATTPCVDIPQELQAVDHLAEMVARRVCRFGDL